MSIPSLKMEIYYLPRKTTPQDVEYAILLKLYELDPHAAVQTRTTTYVCSPVPQY